MNIRVNTIMPGRYFMQNNSQTLKIVADNEKPYTISLFQNLKLITVPFPDFRHNTNTGVREDAVHTRRPLV